MRLFGDEIAVRQRRGLSCRKLDYGQIAEGRIGLLVKLEGRGFSREGRSFYCGAKTQQNGLRHFSGACSWCYCRPNRPRLFDGSLRVGCRE